MSAGIRLLMPEDIPAAVLLKDAAGWNQTALDWERFVSASPEGCFAAEFEGRLIGTSATITYEDRLAWIGMVIVDGQFRGQGIGTALLQRAIAYLDARKIPSVKLDATPQGKLLYQKFGFASEYEIERWNLERAAGEVAAAETSHADLSDILSLDRAIFGADRGSVLRSMANAAPEFVMSKVRKGKIAGYEFGRRGSLADQLGPWMAQDEEVAANLLDEFLRRSGWERVFVDCVRANPWAIRLVQARGFQFSRPLTRMFRGKNDSAGKPELLCAILGPEFG